MQLGLGFSIGLIYISKELYTASIGSMAMLYLKNLITFHVPWSDCNFFGASNSCISMNQKPMPAYTLECCQEYEQKGCNISIRKMSIIR